MPTPFAVSCQRRDEKGTFSVGRMYSGNRFTDRCPDWWDRTSYGNNIVIISCLLVFAWRHPTGGTRILKHLLLRSSSSWLLQALAQATISCRALASKRGQESGRNNMGRPGNSTEMLHWILAWSDPHLVYWAIAYKRLVWQGAYLMFTYRYILNRPKLTSTAWSKLRQS